MKQQINIRSFRKEDAEAVAGIFHKTIREVNSADYSTEQVEAWAPDNIYFRDWETFCLSKHTFIAELKKDIAGFAQIEDNGYIDCFYCHKNYQGLGVGKALFAALLQKAKELGVQKLQAEVSITAKPFFSALGFNLVRKQEVHLRGSCFINYLMEKNLEDE